MNGPERYTFDTIRDQVDVEFRNKEMPKRLYKSTDSIFRIIDAIVKTKGEGWAAQAVDDEGKPILSASEQVKFSEAFKPYLESIIAYFDKTDKESIQGGMYKPDIESLSGMSKDFIKTKLTETTGVNDSSKMVGPDDIYAKIVKKIGNIDATVNGYASKYGVLRLEKEHDLAPDPRIIPQPVASVISSGVAALFKIPPEVTMETLSKIKIPFRTIIFVIYLALDVTRISMGLADRPIARKLLSIALTILELLRGDWKKAILTFIGFYGMSPLLAGEVGKVFLTLFRQLSPQLQTDIIFGSLSVTKSLIVGLLLSIFQITAPEEVRLPLIGALEKVAQIKAEIDNKLITAGLSARPDYLSPTFEDFNNIQAVMNDKAYLCSCEFEQLIETVNKSAAIRIILQILSIPVTKEFRDLQCGTGPCQPFVKQLVIETKKEQAIEGTDAGEAEEAEEAEEAGEPGEAGEAGEPGEPGEPGEVVPDNTIPTPLNVQQRTANEASKLVTGVAQGVTSKVSTATKGVTNKVAAATTVPAQALQKLVTGGRILHSRKNRQSLIA